MFLQGSPTVKPWKVSTPSAGWRESDGGGRTAESLGNIIRGLRANDPKHSDINVTLFFGLEAPGHVNPCLWYLTCLVFMHDYLFWNGKGFFLLCWVKSKQITPLCWTNQVLALKTRFLRTGSITKSVLHFFPVFIKAVTSSIKINRNTHSRIIKPCLSDQWKEKPRPRAL